MLQRYNNTFDYFFTTGFNSGLGITGVVSLFTGDLLINKFAVEGGDFARDADASFLSRFAINSANTLLPRG